MQRFVAGSLGFWLEGFLSSSASCWSTGRHCASTGICEHTVSVHEAGILHEHPRFRSRLSDLLLGTCLPGTGLKT